MSENDEATLQPGEGTEAGSGTGETTDPGTGSGTGETTDPGTGSESADAAQETGAAWPELDFGADRDAIDALIEALNEATGGELTFERDVLDVERPEDWGAVEMTGTVDEWADGEIIDRVYRLDIWAAVSDRASEWLETIENVLRSQGDRLSWRLRERAYLHDLKKVLWRWDATIDSLEAPEAEEGGES